MVRHKASQLAELAFHKRAKIRAPAPTNQADHRHRRRGSCLLRKPSLGPSRRRTAGVRGAPRGTRRCATATCDALPTYDAVDADVAVELRCVAGTHKLWDGCSALAQPSQVQEVIRVPLRGPNDATTCGSSRSRRHGRRWRSRTNGAHTAINSDSRREKRMVEWWRSLSRSRCSWWVELLAPLAVAQPTTLCGAGLARAHTAELSGRTLL